MGKLVFELNEFNEELLLRSAVICKNINRTMSNGRISFRINEKYDSDFLEPWSQWVTVHTGVSCSEHKIKHLGDIHDIELAHVWDRYPENFGIIWGCLNSRNPQSSEIRYFPDPWTSKSFTNIKGRGSILRFLQFAVSARSYDSTVDKLKAYSNVTPHLIYSFAQLCAGVDTTLLKIIKKYHGKVQVNSSYIYAIIEYLNFKVFLREQASEFQKTDVFFANMLAHAQHYYWNTDNHALLEFCIELVDAMLGKAYKLYDDVIVFNGLSQEYSGDLEEWHSWIPTGGWQIFINEKLGINCKVQPCMSYDCNLYFTDQRSKDLACDRLSRIRSQSGENLFLIEQNEQDDSKVFVRLQYYGPGNQEFLDGNSSFFLLNEFDLSAVRSGRHCQYSVAFGAIPDRLKGLSDLNNVESCKLYL